MTVYFIRALNSDRYKIGTSKDVERRLQELRESSPVALGLADYADIFPEAFWHWLFEENRLHGEWFELGEKEISLIARVSEIDILMQQTTRSRADILDLLSDALSIYARKKDQT